jgi:hypothetical protein
MCGMVGLKGGFGNMNGRQRLIPKTFTCASLKPIHRHQADALAVKMQLSHVPVPNLSKF